MQYFRPASSTFQHLLSAFYGYIAGEAALLALAMTTACSLVHPLARHRNARQYLVISCAFSLANRTPMKRSQFARDRTVAARDFSPPLWRLRTAAISLSARLRVTSRMTKRRDGRDYSFAREEKKRISLLAAHNYIRAATLDFLSLARFLLSYEIHLTVRESQRCHPRVFINIFLEKERFDETHRPNVHRDNRADAPTALVAFIRNFHYYRSG